MNLIWKRLKAKKMSAGRFKIDESWVNNPAPFICIYTLCIGRNTRQEQSTNPTKYVLPR